MCPNCNLSGVDPKTRAICEVCGGSPESVGESVAVAEAPVVEEKPKKGKKK